MEKKVYRVYKSFHDSDGSESGTREYGVYSSLEKARERMLSVWEELEYLADAIENRHIIYYDGWDDTYLIGIQEFTLDQNIVTENIGHT